MYNKQGIGQFFCEVITREKELWVIAECLDCIFDVFGEDHINDIIKDIQLLEKLKYMVPHLKAKVSSHQNLISSIISDYHIIITFIM